MKKIIYYALVLAGMLSMNACSDDEFVAGNPVMDFKTEAADALFGDSLPFTIKASDVDVPLSTLKAQLFYGEEKVSETVIRTKVSGEDYSGKLYIPYYKNIPNGKATLKYVLQNINFTLTERETELTLARPDFPYLTLVAEEGEYRLEKTDLYQYAITGKFPQKVKGYIKTPKVGTNGNELTFGWENGAVEVGTTDLIPFSNSKAGKYTISFNSYSYEAAPFVKLQVNGTEMDMVDDNNYKVELTLEPGAEVSFEGIPEFEDWTVDGDFLKAGDDGKFTFLPVSGKYRITANFTFKYVFVEAMNGSNLATLQTDGTGAIWIIGEGIGKPSVGANEVGWNTGKALCMSPIAAKKYQITVVAGKGIKTDKINFKFFHQKDWGGEFGGKDITTDGAIIGIGTGAVADGGNGHDNGNLYLQDGQTLAAGHIYKIVVDVTGGNTKAKMTVTDEGEQPIEIKNMSMGGVKLNSTDGEIYTGVLNLTQNAEVTTGGMGNLEDWFIDPDYFQLNEDGELVFLPLDGSYRITANLARKYVSVVRMNGANEATLGDDGHGAIWLMGWGVGSPSLDQQFGWTPGAAYCLPEVAPKIYRFTCTAGPEKGSEFGHRIRFDYLDAKFFFQDGWGGEFSGDNALTLAAGTEAFLKQPGNLQLVENLEQDATYVLTVDLTAGNNKGIISFEKQ